MPTLRPLALISAAALMSACAQPPYAEPLRQAERPLQADFAQARPSPAAREVADWAVRSGNAQARPFVLIDKPMARVYVFDAQGRLQGDAPALLGLARGDRSVPGIGDRPLSQIARHERTTPAGRFVAEAGHNAKGEDIVWVDYDAAVSMHRVRPLKAEERRLQRLASPSPKDNRISYGCINLPAAFFDQQVKPVFAGGRAIVYVLPDAEPLQAVLPMSTPVSTTGDPRVIQAFTR